MPRFSAARLLQTLLALVWPLVWASPVTISPRTSAQTLQLDAVPPPPTITGESAATRIAAVLRTEIAELEAKGRTPSTPLPNQPLRAAAAGARIALRRLAFDLLVRSVDPAPNSDLLAMQGFRLADNRRRVDLRIERLVEGMGTSPISGAPRTLGVREQDRIRRLLERFSEVAPKAFANINLGDVRQLDAGIAVAVGPLADALATLSGVPTGDALGTGWPTPQMLVSSGATAANRSVLAQADDPCAEATLATTGELTRASVRASCAERDSRESGDAPEVTERILTAIALSSAAQASSLLSDVERSDIDRRSAALVEGKGTVALGLAQARLLQTTQRLAEAKDGLRVDRKALDAAIRQCLFPAVDRGVALTDEPASLARVVQRVTDSVELAARARTNSRPELPKDLKPLLKDFELAYERSETATWAKLANMLADAEALSNPEQTGLVAAQRDALDNLDRLANTQRILDAIGGTRPQAVRGVTVRLKTALRWLLEPTRRSDGMTAYDTLALQVRLFAPLPFESELRRETPEIVAFTGGESAKLAERIDVMRAEWADAWSNGTGNGPAARRMYSLFRLLRSMEDLSRGGGPDDRDAAATLSRWGGFHATKAALAPALLDVEAMTKLAVDAAIEGDDARLDRELARIERDAPLAQLIGRLIGDLGPWLDTRPGEALGAIAAMRESPTSDSWGLAVRSRLASVGRYARELDEARRGSRTADEKAIVQFLSRLASSTLEALGAERSPLPVLPNLDATTEPADGRKTPPNRRRDARP